MRALADSSAIVSDEGGTMVTVSSRVFTTRPARNVPRRSR
jgi:hypothetical protein